MAFDAATVLLMWAVGSLAFGWVTFRRTEVGRGYGWLVRITFGLIAMGAALAALRWPFSGASKSGAPASGSAAADFVTAATVIVALATFAAAGWALLGSIARRQQGRWSRVSELSQVRTSTDLLAPALGAVGLVVISISQGLADEANLGETAVHTLRLISGAAFLGVVSDSMLLGHWYLVQPGLRREPLLELVRWLRRLWPIEVAAMLAPVGMISVFVGTIDDGYAGLLGWFWATCAIATIILALVAAKALAEPQYQAVMAATGLLYLAILSGFGTDLVARLTLAA